MNMNTYFFHSYYNFFATLGSGESNSFGMNTMNIIYNFGSLFLQDSEHIGEIFQDQENMAAILMRRHASNGDLLMVSCVNQTNCNLN